MSEIKFRGWISYAGSNQEEGKAELQKIGVTVGIYNPTKEYFQDCEVTPSQLQQLDKRFGEFVWSLK